VSASAIAWAFEQEIGPVRKILLLCLSDEAGPDGIVVADKSALAVKSSLSHAELVEKIEALEKFRLIARLPNDSPTRICVRLLCPAERLAYERWP
jgi:hypothetical protein